jgi:hypothetical protein
MSVRAKFKCVSVERSKYGSDELQTIKLEPVYGNGDPNHENTKFYKHTPSGHIHLGTVNPDAAKQFELGKEYYIDFTPAQPS